MPAPAALPALCLCVCVLFGRLPGISRARVHFQLSVLPVAIVLLLHWQLLVGVATAVAIAIAVADAALATIAGSATSPRPQCQRLLIHFCDPISLNYSPPRLTLLRAFVL